IPVPETAERCVPLSSTTCREAERAPAADGLKVTVTVQVPPAATVAPHVVVLAKSAALVPLRPIDEMLRVSVPAVLSTVNANPLRSEARRGGPKWWLAVGTAVCGKIRVSE